MKEPCPAQNRGLYAVLEGRLQHFFVKCQSQSDVYICMDHSLPLDLYCGSCKETLCVNCYLSKHRDHNTKPIGYGRDEAVQLIETIKSIGHDNIPNYARLHQVASDVFKSAEVDEKSIIRQIDAQERKIHALISSLFSKAKLSYRGSIRVKSKTAEEAIAFCQKSMSKEIGDDFQELNDFELACLVKDLYPGLIRWQGDAVSIDERVELLTGHKYQGAFDLRINDTAIFNVILQIFDHVRLEPQLGGKFIPHGFMFEKYYSDANCSDNHEEEEANNMDKVLSAQPKGILATMPSVFLDYSVESIYHYILRSLKCK